MSTVEQSETKHGLLWLPPEEYRVRTSRLQSRLATQGVGAAVITSPPNFHYFTGVHSPSFLSNARPQICVIPADGLPVLVVSRSQAPNAAACSWIKQIDTFEGFEPESLEVVANTLDEMGIVGEHVGFEFGSEHRLGLTINGLHWLESKIDGSKFVDIASELWKLRMVKSPREVEELRAAAQATATAMETAIGHARPGITEVAVRRHFLTALVELGLDPGYLAVHSGVGNYDKVNADASLRQLQRGDLLWLDGGGISKGYRADITRLVSIGEPSAEARRSYHQAHRLSSSLMETVTTGMQASELMSACRGLFDREAQVIGSATRVGHGIGLELTEPPSIVDGDDTRLDLGMCLALEPGIATPYGYFVLEEDIVITGTGAERISPPNPEELQAV